MTACNHSKHIMIPALTTILVFQLIGETLARGLGLPIPGPVIGMGLLFAMLVWRGKVSDELRDTSLNLLRHLSLLFIPAGTGIMLHFHRLSDEWLPVTISLILSTLLTLVLTAGVLRLLARQNRSATQAGEPS